MTASAGGTGLGEAPEHVNDLAVRVLDYLTLDIGATTENLRLARLVVAGLGAGTGATIDDLEDLRIATDEICSHLVNLSDSRNRLVMSAVVLEGPDPKAASVASGSGDDLETAPDDLLHAGAPDRYGPRTVCVHATIDVESESPAMDELSQMILGSVTDAFGFQAHRASGDSSWTADDINGQNRYRLEFTHESDRVGEPDLENWGTLNAWFSRTLGHVGRGEDLRS